MNIKDILASLKSGEKIEDLIKVEKSYIPLILKRSILNNVIDLSTFVDDETQMMKYDSTMIELFTVLLTTVEVAAIEIDNLFEDNGDINMDNALEIYDVLMEYNIYECICRQLSNNDIECLIERELDQRLQIHNSVSAVLSRAIAKVVDMLPDVESMQSLVKDLPSMIGGLNGLEILGGNVKAARKSKK